VTEYTFREKLTQYKNTVFRLAVGYTKNIQDAEDITQDVFLKLYCNEKEFESDEHEKAWLIRVTVNLCKNHLKTSWMRLRSPQSEYDSNTAFYDESNIEMMEMLSKVKPDYRVLLYLFYYEQYKTYEIAKILKRNENTVRTQLKRAREQLRLLMLEERGELYEYKV